MSVLFSVCQLDQFLVKNVCRKFFLHHLRTFSKNLSVFFRKSFVQLNKTAFHVSRGKIWGQNIVLTKMLFVFFHVLPKLNGEITVFFVKKNNRQICHICLPRIQEDFLKKFFLIKFFFFIIGHWATFVCHFDEILSVQMSVLLSACQLDQIVVKKFLSNIFFSINYRHWSQIISLCSNFFGQVDDTAFYGSKGLIWGLKAVLTSFCLFYLSFADLEPKDQGFFSENNRQGCQNCSPRVHWDILQGFFFEKFFLFDHWALIDICLSFRRKIVAPFVSTVFCLSIRPVSGEKCLSKIFSPSFTDIQQKFVWFFSENLSVNLTKLHSTSPEEKFEDKTLFWQRCCLFFSCSSKIERRNNGFFVKKTIGKFVTFAYHVSKNIFWRSFFWKSSFFSSLGIEQLLYVISTKFCQSRSQYCFLFVN